MPLKTLHLTNYWHDSSGGIATFYRALIAAANRRGHLMRLVVPSEHERTEEIGDFARMYYVKAPRARFNSDYRVIYPTEFLRAKSPLQRILIRERPDLVEVCDKYTLHYLGLLLRKRWLSGVDFRPAVIGLSCERMDDNFDAYIGRVPLGSSFCAAYMKWLYFPFFDHHLANSEYTASELRTASEGQNSLRSISIRPMGVDLRQFSPALKSPEARQRLLEKCQGRLDTVLLVYAGRLAPEKNLPLLFKTFARLLQDTERDSRLLVAGDGVDRWKWEAFCATNTPGRVSFLGHVSQPSELASLLANSDIFIHPNPREPFGIGPLEAMASGLPVVVPNRGGVTTYANSQNSWLAAPDPMGFASTVEAILRDPCEATRRAQNALEVAANLSWESVAGSFLDLYGDVHDAISRSPERL